MARQDINSVNTLGNEERIDDNFVELYATVYAASANYAATVSAGTLVSGGAVNGASANFTATCSAAVIVSTGAVVGASANFTATCSAAAIVATTFNGVTLDNTAFSTYSPTVTASTGTFTSVSATGRYKQIGKTVFVEIVITVTTAGTAANTLQVTLPVAEHATAAYAISGRNSNGIAITGLTLGGAGGAGLGILRYDNTAIIASGVTYTVSGIYEAA